MLVSELLRASLRLIGVLSVGEAVLDTQQISGTRTSATMFTRSSGVWLANILVNQFAYSYDPASPTTGVWLPITANTTTTVTVNGTLDAVGTAIITNPFKFSGSTVAFRGGALVDQLSALQIMLRSWAQKNILVYASTRESFMLVPSQTLYTWGLGANINTDRPLEVIDAFVRDSEGDDISVDVISESEYNAIKVKGTLGRPEYLFYRPSYPYGSLYLFPTPQDAEVLWLESMKEFTETSSFDTVDATLSFPPNYQEPIIYNLAIRLAPQYGITVSSEVVTVATQGYDALTALNAANQVQPIRPRFPIKGSPSATGMRYNINQG